MSDDDCIKITGGNPAAEPLSVLGLEVPLGCHQDVRSGMPRFSSREALHANQELLDLLQSQAAEKGCTMAQLALAWLLAQRPWIVPIPGTTKLKRLEENIGAANVHFTVDELKDLNKKLEQIQIHGARYNAQQESMVEK